MVALDPYYSINVALRLTHWEPGNEQNQKWEFRVSHFLKVSSKVPANNKFFVGFFGKTKMTVVTPELRSVKKKPG